MANRRIRVLWGDERAGALARLSLPRWAAESAAAGTCALLLLGLPLFGQAARRWHERAVRAGALAEEGRTLTEQLLLVGRAQGQLKGLMARNERSLQALVAKQPPPPSSPLVDSGPALADSGARSRGPAATKPTSALPPRFGVDDVAALYSRAQAQEAQLLALLDYWSHAERRLQHTPAVRPVQVAWLSSSFGVRTDPISGALLMHKGLDLAGQPGMPIFAPADGVVIWVGTRGGYGQTVVVDHGWGLQTHFAHLSAYRTRIGAAVRRGEVIAEMGSTGKSTGPHLHYEVRLDGYPIDPRKFILD